MTYISWSSDFACILKTIWCMNIIIRDYESVWPDVDLKINVGHFDLYFMIHWFLRISWRLFDLWTSYFLDYGSVWPDIWPQNKCMSLWAIVHGPVILPYISKTVWRTGVIFSDNETGWPKLWPQNKNRSTWPVFHGLVILFNIFKIIWWTNMIVCIMDQCDTKIDLIKYM